jgi:hypothetical protein
MFPLEYPLSILRGRDGVKRVLDPFCGRGTTLYAARVIGIESWGMDTSPVAVAIARAKLSHATPKQALSLAKEILASESERPLPAGPFWKNAFHPKTLEEVCRLRSGLMRRRSEAAALLRAIALGCLHGPLTKVVNSPSYFSNQMPRTFAPKPDYAVGYWKREKLRPPKASVIKVLAKKAARLECEWRPARASINNVIHGDSQLPATFLTLPGGIDTVITSPPYFGMMLYVQDQWLRNWFLGGPDAVDYSQTGQLAHSSPESFAESLAHVWDNVGRVRRRRRRQDLFIRFGAIPSKKVDAREVLQHSLSLSRYPWRIVEMKSAKSAVSGKRQAAHMNVDSRSVREYDIHAALAADRIANV